jgi:hypothetical protein
MQSSRRPPLREQRLDLSGKSTAFIYYSEILPAHRAAFAGAPFAPRAASSPSTAPRRSGNLSGIIAQGKPLS